MSIWDTRFCGARARLASIWSTRFGRRGVAFDGRANPDQWITVHPNDEGKGHHVLIDGDTGEVKAGMGGKFKGVHVRGVPGYRGQAGKRPLAPVYKPENSKKPQAPEPVEQSLGVKRGAPMTVVDAAKDTNPKYSSQQKEYRINCQRCVQAYELRRRGYDAEALPNVRGKSRVMWGIECFLPQEKAQDINSVIAEYTKLNSRTRKKAKADVTNAALSAPDGARFVVYVAWKRGSAHVFMAENESGKVRFVDPQNNKPDVGWYFDHVKPAKTRIFRVDDKVITSDTAIIKEAAKPA